MAVFTLGTEENGKKAVYRTEKDLRNLLFYAYNHSSYTIMENLYPIGEGFIEYIFNQMMRLQWRRVKSVNTRALHYILSFDTLRWEKDVDQSKMMEIMHFLNEYLFGEYQHILFLHLDKPSHYHIHMIVNPVNIYTLRLCRETWEGIGWQIADLLGSFYNIPLQSFTYRDYDGRMKRGQETGVDLYKDKWVKEIGIENRVPYLKD